jgi:hypothetical protein
MTNDDETTNGPKEDKERGESYMPPWAITFIVLAMLAMAVVALYGLWAFWPSEAPAKKAPALSKTVHFFGYHRHMSRESLFFVMVAFAGALGSALHGLRSLVDYIGERELRWSWGPFYLVRPVIGALLATLLYVVLRAGLFSPSSSSQQTSPYGFAAVASLAGLFNDQAIEKLKSVAEELFEKPPLRKDSLSALPTAQSGDATVLGPTTAVVTGTVNPRGLLTSTRFEYGTTNQYGQETEAGTAGTGRIERPVRETLTGLSPDTTYHYRLVAQSEAGTTPGDDKQFRTQPAAGGI